LTFLALACSTLLAAAPLPAQPAAAPPVAFLGLRPAVDRSLGATAIAQLGEAQRFRSVAESVTVALTGANVLGHAELRGLLGGAYLVDLFDCRGEPGCAAALAAPLRGAGVRVALVGDYHRDETTLHLRIVRLDLEGGKAVDRVTFPVPRAEAEALGPWRAGLAPLLRDEGSILVVTNVPDASCTLDGRPCPRTPEGTIADVSEGEHVLELSKAGYRRATRVVSVRRREQVRVAVALEELPTQVVQAPDPSARVPTFAPPTEETQLTPFGLLRLAVVLDDLDAGEREDPAVVPGVPRERAVVFLPRPAVLGVTVQAPRRRSGWQVRGALSTAWVKDDGPELDSAYAEVLNQEAGFRTMLGLGPGVVSSLTAGTITLPEGFGDLSAAFVGVTASQSFGPLVAEAFVGKHKSQFSADPAPGTTSPAPFVGGRLALVHEGVMGRLYGEDYPLTLSISGLWGEERVGIGDEVTVPDPVPEQIDVWVGSAEAFVPVGGAVSLAGEAFLGQDLHLLEGALWQQPRVDPATGRHRGLRSAGGWVQVSVSLGEALVARLVAGLDRVLDGLEYGDSVDGSPAIRENRLGAVILVWHLDHLALGFQLHAVRTAFDDPALGSATIKAAVLGAQLSF
jgi:hypothetical protein